MSAVPFVVFGLPRSRTFWISRWLSYGGWECHHDEARHFRSIDDIRAFLSMPCTGSVETAAAPFWRTLQRMAPTTRVVVVRRSPADVLASLGRLGVAFDMALLNSVIRGLDAKLDQIEARWPGVLSVQFDDLAHEETCAQVFEHCLPFKHDPAWWQMMAGMNLQTSMPAAVRYMGAYASALLKLAAQVKQQSLVAMRSRPVVEPAGITFQTETFDSFYEGAQELFRNHLVAVGEHPDNAANKNIPLMRLLYDAGAMQITTARSNGRVFGYLMTIIGPSLESADTLAATHTVFYGSPDVPGLGMKLQRAALASLRDRGVNELYFRAGPRGAGPKMGALYRRLGAVADGEMFKLDVH